ncbi:hypothetical protein QBC34DRAFT_438049 [Podospora aff. communis PSN243]|uniref:Ankyrin n=1 Tax=Podospora aff. communis PSN243 TaxID=3040156 RepID=A0AAV9GPK6_9PEZI|nr:hypothetical protein QBC34DRAFT_438049 [Podospora aff. communis PSN243]
MEKKERRRSSLLLFPPVRASALGSSRTPIARGKAKPSADDLFSAIQNRDLGLAQRLIEGGVDIESFRGGKTPLILAVDIGFADAVRMLTRLGADLSSQFSGLDPPLLVAAKAGNLDMVALLLELGADPDGKGSGFPYTSDTPLLVAAETDNEAMLTMLLRRGAAIDLTPLGRLRPMLAAAVKGQKRVARMLLEHGADPKLGDLEPAVRDSVLLCLPELELWEYACGTPEFASLSELLAAVEDITSGAALGDKLGLEYVTWEWTVPEGLSIEAETGKVDLRNEVILIEDTTRPLQKAPQIRCMTVGQWIDELAEESDGILAEEFLRHVSSPSCQDGEIEDNTAWSAPFPEWKTLGASDIRVRTNKNGLHIPLRDIISSTSASTRGFAVVDWLCRAFLRFIEGSGLNIIASKYRLERFAAIHDGTFGLPEYLLRIKVILERKPFPESQYGCWRRLFNSCHVLGQQVDDDFGQTIEEGPLSPRPLLHLPDGFGRGLEIPFDLMICLTAAELPLVIDGGAVFVGYETILVPTAISEDRSAVQFHLITHPKSADSCGEGRGQINPYNTNLGTRLKGRSMKTEWLRSRRCFLGWRAEAKINLGTRNLDPRVGYSHRDRRTSRRSSVVGGYETALQAGTGPGVSALVKVQQTYRFTSHQRQFTPTGDYSKLLRDTAAETAAVYDAQERRCWLVPRLSLLLHMSHTYVLNCPDSPAHNVPSVDPHTDATDIIHILEPLVNQPVFQNSKLTAPLLLRHLLLGLNTNLLPLPTPNPTKSPLHGFEYLEATTTPGRGSCMKPLPSLPSRPWLDLLSSIPTIITCSSLGDAITPAPSSSGPRNPLCAIIPRNQDFLTATIPVLSRLARRAGAELPVSSSTADTSPKYAQPNPATYKPVRLAENSVWNVSGDPFEECTHGEQAGETCWERRGLLQRLEAKGTNRLRKLVGGSVAEGEKSRKKERRRTWMGMSVGMGMSSSSTGVSSSVVEEGGIPRAMPAGGAVVFGR